jgi:hypothetical protein
MNFIVFAIDKGIVGRWMMTSLEYDLDRLDDKKLRTAVKLPSNTHKRASKLLDAGPDPLR